MNRVIVYLMFALNLFVSPAYAQTIKYYAGWTISCDTDQMTDKVSCVMSHDPLELKVWLTEETGYFVGVGKNHFPGKPAMVRIDNNLPIVGSSTNEGVFGSTADSIIIEQMKVGKVVKTRYSKWPSEASVDDASPIVGFVEALDGLTKEYNIMVELNRQLNTTKE